MEEYASNSHKSRQERNAELPEKKPEKIVTGEVVTSKKSGVRKFADSLISCGVENVRDYIFDEIVAPKVKDMIYGVAEKLCDGLKDGISDILYGKDAHDSDYPHYHAYYGDKRNARTVSYRSPDDYEDLIKLFFAEISVGQRLNGRHYGYSHEKRSLDAYRF